ncbi:DUF6908 domain-containing protein [Sphingobacterium detergens]|uniref:DUF6908 domain-containing protein n=1 Tax=Sphingobacterium detergens TaxID=1145106 RepID=A0A420ARU1_SPHD1|nr:hypothetical protein [Sphingobacterium detergens]RKE47145.1 hypothetical protein DFQ12_4306 [Sphingobacterium detergens]
MEFLNKEATKIFEKLNNQLDDGYLKIENSPYMPLTMQNLDWPIYTNWGKAKTISLCNYYIFQGQIMFTPEMHFLVIDWCNHSSVFNDNLRIIPYLYFLSNLGVYNDSIITQNSVLSQINPDLQKHQTEFANDWLINIRDKGYLNR